MPFLLSIQPVSSWNFPLAKTSQTSGGNHIIIGFFHLIFNFPNSYSKKTKEQQPNMQKKKKQTLVHLLPKSLLPPLFFLF